MKHESLVLLVLKLLWDFYYTKVRPNQIWRDENGAHSLIIYVLAISGWVAHVYNKTLLIFTLQHCIACPVKSVQSTCICTILTPHISSIPEMKEIPRSS